MGKVGMVRALLWFLLLAALGIGSRVALPIEEVEVVGLRHLSAEAVQQITGLKPGQPWLWAWPYRLEPLRQNPWVKTAILERPALGRLRIVLEERSPVAHLVQRQRRYGLSPEGVLLPDAPAKGPFLEGRGEAPIADLLALVAIFPQAERIRYDVGGYQVLGPSLNVWGRNVSELQDWAQARKMGRSDAKTLPPDVLLGSRIYVYSWGVSAQQ